MIKFTNLYPELQNEIVKKCTNCEKFPLMFVNRQLNKLSRIVPEDHCIVNDYIKSDNLNLLKWMYSINYRLQIEHIVAFYGKLHILEWLYETNKYISPTCGFYAEYNRQDHIVAWLKTKNIVINWLKPED